MDNDKESVSFIEKQFPVSKISKECYRERKAVRKQTLTSLGKWWGRKPLFLVRAIILGLIMPSTDNPKKDRDIYLKILTMDDMGLYLRKNKPVDLNIIFAKLTYTERQKYFEDEKKLKSGISNEEKKYLQKLIFERLSYDEKLPYCVRPEEIEINDLLIWNDINSYLNTNSYNIQDLIKELALKKYGKIPKIGDCFSGGGSIPFEAARLGLKVFASDLNPIAMLQTWAAINILGEKKENIEKLNLFQIRVLDKVIHYYFDSRLELNEEDLIGKFYLYCNEARCPECGYIIPLSPNWHIDKALKTVAILKENKNKNNFEIEIKQNASDEEIKLSENQITIRRSQLYCPHCNKTTPITSLRKDMKSKKNSMLICHKEDHLVGSGIFFERLYAIKYLKKKENKTWGELIKKIPAATDTTFSEIYYTNPNDNDLKREQSVISILEEKFERWQKKGFIPSGRIIEGDETSRLLREKGWTYWNQLFNPRQLLLHGLLMETIAEEVKDMKERVVGLLAINRCCDWNSKLSNWNDVFACAINTFYNQALNTLYNYGCRGISAIYSTWMLNLINNIPIDSNNCEIELKDARKIDGTCDIWITDPPYADAVNYHELSEFFLAWDKKPLEEIFPDWYTDSKRALAVRGNGIDFNKSMIEIYKNLNKHMPENGVQVVMFTHQSVKVWAELTLILWQSELQVVAAWNIATETESGGLKQGNYVKGTVILVLKKQKSDKTSFLDELQPQIEQEVKQQIDYMRDIDDKDDPNFNDADYLLAAYAASLKVLTSYKNIEDIDINYELAKQRNEKEPSKIEKIINQAVKIAYDYLIPEGFDQYNWRLLIPVERFYIKGLEVEKNGSYKISSYQELARGFGVKDYKDYLASVKANNARLKTATELGTKTFSQSTFGNTILRNVFLALNQAIKEENALNGKNWLRNELSNYWNSRNIIIEILEFISTFEFINNMGHWKNEAVYSKLLKELVRNDGI